MAYIELVSSGLTTLKVCVAGLDESYSRDDRQITWYIDEEESSTSQLGAGVSASKNKTFRNLEPGTDYLIEACISFTDSGNDSEKWLSETFSTEALDTPYYEIDSVDDTLVDIYYENPHDYIRFFLKKSSTGAQVYDSGVIDGYGVDYYTIEGLSPGTTYIANVGWADENTTGNVTWIGAQEFTTESGLTDYYWDWDSSNGEASASQTKTAHEAITGHGPISDFSFKVWNDLCNKVSAVYVSQGEDEWATDNGNLSLMDTRMTATDRTLTADRFNSLKYNIGRRCPTGISDVSSGDPVYGSYFITIAEKLNEWIESLSTE